MILGSLCSLYFIGITVYAGLSSLFPCIWAAGGVFFYGIAVLLHLNSRHGVLAGFSLPPVIKNSLIVLAALCILVFLTVEALIFTGMFHHPSENLDYLVVRPGKRYKAEQLPETPGGACRGVSGGKP